MGSPDPRHPGGAPIPATVHPVAAQAEKCYLVEIDAVAVLA